MDGHEHNVYAPGKVWKDPLTFRVQEGFIPSDCDLLRSCRISSVNETGDFDARDGRDGGAHSPASEDFAMYRCD
jgi:hypothetical protein